MEAHRSCFYSVPGSNVHTKPQSFQRIINLKFFFVSLPAPSDYECLRECRVCLRVSSLFALGLRRCLVNLYVNIMTTVNINTGACGYTVTITAEKAADGKIRITLETECEMVKKMLEDIQVLDRFTPFSGFLNNPVFQSAAKHLKHPACIVPAGILKAVEVEAGLNVAHDASIIFEKQK